MQSLTYKVRPVPKSDFEQVIELWGLAFGNPDAEPTPNTEAWREQAKDFLEKGVEYLVGSYEGSSLAAVASIIDFPMHLGNRWVTCGGIAGVATHPQHRRQGLQ